MKLLNQKLIKRFAKIGRQEEVKDPIVVAIFFNPAGAGTWFATEYYPQTETFFGYVSIFGDHNDEWGYFRLEELESYQGRWRLGIERDRFFKECPISQVQPKAIVS